MIDEAKRMSGSSVIPAGSKRLFTNASTNARIGTPYCKPYEIDLAKASMMPLSVEPCFDTVRKISPGRPSAYSPMVAKPLQSATRNSKVRELRVRGSFWRTGWCTTFSTMRSMTWLALAAAGVLSSAPSFLAVLSGWPTLQLSR